MVKNIDLAECSFEDFFEYFENQNGIGKIWKKIVNLVSDIEPELKNDSDVLKLLVIYFSLLDDGNICAALEKEILLKKITDKLCGLHLIAMSEENQDFSAIELSEKEELSKVIATGIEHMLSGKYQKVFHQVLADNDEDGKFPFKIVLIKNVKWLFTDKFYCAKVIIENRVSAIFPKEKRISDSVQNPEVIRDYFTKITKPFNGNPFVLNKEQLSAVVRGINENLFITGGPGTGKTTVVFYLLWELLKNKKYENSKVYLAAPSGKASDRLRESIIESLDSIVESEREKETEVFERLNSLQSFTIHRLLEYNPESNAFKYNEKNQFEENSIFVIDEASMIDINLFQSLLSAIPDNSRLFVLGDKNQLPSVQAGAVLGNLLARKTDSLVELIYSNRFKDDSEVGVLSKAIQLEEDCNTHWELWNSLEKDFRFKDAAGKISQNDEMPVFYYEAENKEVRKIAEKWNQEYYGELISLCKDVVEDEQINQKLDRIWKISTFARILCAERKGYRGVEKINSQIHMMNSSDGEFQTAEIQSGELLMITRNQSLFNLYNGDSGVTITFKDKNQLYLMLQKSVQSKSETEADKNNKNGIFSIGNYIFYPLNILPSDAIELAYAITVHKAQGSGYNAILVILPEQPGHPLLNRQILYTAITRTKGKTFIIANEETFNSAKNTVIERDTMIEM